MPRVLAAAGLVLLVAASGDAQTFGEVLRKPPLYALEQAPPYPDAVRQHEHDDTALWVFVGAAGADWSVTSVCLKYQCGPDTKGFTSIDAPKKATGIGLLIDGVFVYAVREWVQPDHPQIAKTLFYGAAVVRAMLVTHKVGDLRRNTARTAPPGT